ncbi:hypothetical protein LNP24_16750 [Klebsiella pneumoniae subsp. pneumoniae]|nr:hypothetical protein [Klebsiella pneumoniae subsp. pneumoniae]
MRSAAIHGNKSQGARTRALADFKSGGIRVLVATDIARPRSGYRRAAARGETTSCRTYRKITSTVSAVPVARRPPAKPYHWCAWMSISCCAISSAC